MSGEYIPLVEFENDYEILNKYPFTIRRKSDHFEIKENVHKVNRYITVCLNQKSYYKHVLVAKQFIPNDDPENKNEVDHINHGRTDYHLSNLRWVSHSKNCVNKSGNRSVKYEFIDDIPEDAIIVDFYNNYTFEENRYYFYHDDENNEDIFYGKTSDNVYKVLHVNIARGGKKYVSLQDVNNKRVSVYIDRYRYQHDI
mgnify:CR=1 FL=1